MGEERLDIRLARETGLTRSRVERLIREGRARVNGRVEQKPGSKVGDEADVALQIPAAAPIVAAAEPLPLEIIYQDAHIAVVNKPVGMVVHPAAGNETGTLVNALLYHLKDLSGIGGALRPGIVHRLDKDTSGLLLIAKDDAAHAALSAALSAREIDKYYCAVVRGRMKAQDGVIEAPIGRHVSDRKRMAVVPQGRYARTEYSVLRELRGATMLRVRLITGRTHQIRVHFASIGHPVLGDPLYGGKDFAKDAPRLMLHAWELFFSHPVTGVPLHFIAPPPDAFEKNL